MCTTNTTSPLIPTHQSANLPNTTESIFTNATPSSSSIPLYATIYSPIATQHQNQGTPQSPSILKSSVKITISATSGFSKPIPIQPKANRKLEFTDSDLLSLTATTAKTILPIPQQIQNPSIVQEQGQKTEPTRYFFEKLPKELLFQLTSNHFFSNVNDLKTITDILIDRFVRLEKKSYKDIFIKNLDPILQKDNQKNFYKILKTIKYDPAILPSVWKETLANTKTLHLGEADFNAVEKDSKVLPGLLKHLPQLESLRLTGVTLSASTLSQIATLGRSLKELHFEHCKVEDYAILATTLSTIAQAKKLTHLTLLGLEEKMTNAHFLACKLPDTLTSLNLTLNTALGSPVMQQIANQAPHLDTLIINSTAVTPEDLSLFKNKLRQLKVLDLTNCQKLFKKDLSALENLPLTALKMKRFKFDPLMVPDFSKIGSLQVLDLRFSEGLTKKIIKAIEKILPHLEYISLLNSRYVNEGRAEYIPDETFKDLKNINTRISPRMRDTPQVFSFPIKINQ